MKRLLITIITLTVALGIFAENKAKYVFYFITDGTGINTVLGAEMYNAELQGIIGRTPFCMSAFPIVSVSSTFSHNSGVTDSAASGSALATGVKTVNGCLGLMPDLKTTASSIAVWAKEAGMKVGIATSVTINHATPAAFYAHQSSRSDYYVVGKDMISADFDFYAGASIAKVEDARKHPGEPNLYHEMEKAGYAIAYGTKDYYSKAGKAKKMLLVQNPDCLNPASGNDALPYAIDAQEGEMRIEDILKCQLDFLMRDNDKGFFLMNEIGGKVDWACHAHDAATAFAEIAAVDRCMKIAFDFYKQHPDETLIVLTADHETGGLVLADDNIYALNLKVLQHQKRSIDGFTNVLRDLRKQTFNKVTWEQAKLALTENFGFWKEIELNEKETSRLYETWQKSFVEKADDIKNEYTSNEPLADEAKHIINKKALLSWSTRGHSAGLVPVYACGVGAELFATHNDNANIPVKIAKAAQWERLNKK